MSILGALFGDSKKNTTTSTTTATQNTSNISASEGSILAQAGANIDAHTDYRMVDHRDFSDKSVTNLDSRDMSVRYDVSGDVIANALSFANQTDERRSTDYGKGLDTIYNASLAFFDHSADALRENYDRSATTLADVTNRTIDAVVSANQSDGAGLKDTFDKLSKYALWIIMGGIAVAAFRS